jgi:hypothetical protein
MFDARLGEMKTMFDAMLGEMKTMFDAMLGEMKTMFVRAKTDLRGLLFHYKYPTHRVGLEQSGFHHYLIEN